MAREEKQKRNIYDDMLCHPLYSVRAAIASHRDVPITKLKDRLDIEKDLHVVKALLLNKSMLAKGYTSKYILDSFNDKILAAVMYDQEFSGRLRLALKEIQS